MKAICPKCGWSKEVPEGWRGKKGKCPDCKTVIQIGCTSQPENIQAKYLCKACGEQVHKYSELCPNCGEEFPLVGIIKYCDTCHKELSKIATQCPDCECSNIQEKPLHTHECIECGKLIKADSRNCTHCGADNLWVNYSKTNHPAMAISDNKSDKNNPTDSCCLGGCLIFFIMIAVLIVLGSTCETDDKSFQQQQFEMRKQREDREVREIFNKLREEQEYRNWRRRNP